MDAPIKHHYVPQFLLRNFAGSKEELIVHRVDHDRSFPAKVLKTGHRNDGHTLYGPGYDGGKDRSTLETMMSALEGETNLVIDELVATKTTEVSPEQKEVLRWFAGLQIARSRFLFGYILRSNEYDLDAKDMANDEIQTSLLSAGPLSHLVAWEKSKDPHSHYKDRFTPFGSGLMAFRWDVVRFREPSLVISDNFVSQSGIRVENRNDYTHVQKNWAKHGMGVPRSQSARVTMALTPTLGLHLHRGATRRTLKADAFNRDTIYSAKEFVAHAPGWESSKPHLSESMVENLSVQRMLRAVMAKSF